MNETTPEHYDGVHRNVIENYRHKFAEVQGFAFNGTQREIAAAVNKVGALRTAEEEETEVLNEMVEIDATYGDPA